MGQGQCCESSADKRGCCSDPSTGNVVVAAKPASTSSPGFSTNEAMDLGLNQTSSPRAPPSNGDAESQQQEVSLTYKDGSTYVGQFQSGKRHGQGVWKSTSVQYEGQFKNDRQDGEGNQTWRDGRFYTGHFEDGKFNGHGRMEWHTPSGLLVFEGQYVSDTKHGRGKFIWPDGRIYDGEWSQGKRWGKGTYINARGERKQGIWSDDKLEKWCEPDAAPSNQ